MSGCWALNISLVAIGLHSLGMLYLEQGKYDEAECALLRSTRISGNHWQWTIAKKMKYVWYISGWLFTPGEKP